MAGDGAAEANRQEDRSDDDVEAVEAGRHEEGRAVDGAEIADAHRKAGMRRIREGRQRQAIKAEGERRVGILVGLNAGERGAKQHRQKQTLHGALFVAMLDGVMCPSHRRARGEED